MKRKRKNKGDSSINRDNYRFDGEYFENIEKIGAFPPIINLKNAIKQENEEIVEISDPERLITQYKLVSEKELIMGVFLFDGKALLSSVSTQAAHRLIEREFRNCSLSSKTPIKSCLNHL